MQCGHEKTDSVDAAAGRLCVGLPRPAQSEGYRARVGDTQAPVAAQTSTSLQAAGSICGSDQYHFAPEEEGHPGGGLVCSDGSNVKYVQPTSDSDEWAYCCGDCLVRAEIILSQPLAAAAVVCHRGGPRSPIVRGGGNAVTDRDPH